MVGGGSLARTGVKPGMRYAAVVVSQNQYNQRPQTQAQPENLTWISVKNTVRESVMDFFKNTAIHVLLFVSNNIYTLSQSYQVMLWQ